ncbi:MAG: agmatine/peptidylarginine deiminase [Acidobacteriota bacterium]
MAGRTRPEPDPTPAELGFRIPAEWERHTATWLAWPHKTRDWPGKFPLIPAVYVEVIRHLSRTESVEVLVQGPSVRRRLGRLLEEAHVDGRRVRFHVIPTDRSWTRDYMPSFIRRGGETALVDWHFNGWARYGDWRRDDAVGERLSRLLGLRRFVPRWPRHTSRRRVVLEGGSIDANGEGLLLTTEACLLSAVQPRNAGVTKAHMERILGDYLGIRKVLWLGEGIAGDDTHGHVDDLARFVGPRSVVVVEEKDPADIHYRPLRDNLRRVRRMRDLRGRPLEVATLPMPAPLFFRGVRLPASYANFYVANGLVLVPTFNDPHDLLALETLARLFPRRQIRGIHALDLVWGLGTLHCMTHQQPA